MVRRLSGRVIALVIVAAVVIAVVAWRVGGGGGYTITIVFPAATNLNTGGLVQEQGFTVGNVKHLSVNNGQALVKISVKSANAPLHSGTTAAIDYRSLLGERYVELTPGPSKNPVIKNGGILANDQDGSVVPRVEISQILNQFDPTTRSQVADLLPQLQQVFAGSSTENTQQTLQAAEPTVKALSEVLDAVGADGQTLDQLVADMANLSGRLVNKQNSLVSTVSGLDRSMNAVATRTQQLQAGIATLPGTLTQAETTLDKVPTTTNIALPLLGDLKTATNGLPAFSSLLEPVLTELQPVSAELIPTLNGLSNLLQYTPTLESSANGLLPNATKALTEAEPALNYLRPYSPEITGTLSNWANWLATYNDTGHLGSVAANIGLGSTVLPIPGLSLGNVGLGAASTKDYSRQPGAIAGQSAPVDAAGNPIQ